MRELLILRHGKSDWDVEVDDFHRPLRDRGKRGAQRIGVWLQKQHLIPDHILSSPAERAIVTAEKCCKAMGMGAQGIHKDERIYGADVERLLEVLRESPDEARRVMLVGHNPGFENLVMALSDKPVPIPEDGKLLPTATLAHMVFNGDWQGLSAAGAELVSITRSTTLPKKFPYPGLEGTERRDRPAYYYTQSSVIPYRLTNGKPEILIVSSSKQKHWVIPKGIKDPGLSPQASAAKEAWEEAGVEGRVADQPIGSYVYEKWGSSCQVEVYPMEVTTVIEEAEWEERHRGRKWVSPVTAAEFLRQEELKPMIHQLVMTLVDKR